MVQTPTEYIPAFPSQQSETLDGSWNQTYTPGMSLRDYFAAKVCEQALAEAFANDCLEGAAHAELCEWAASLAYEMAGAMLVERAK